MVSRPDGWAATFQGGSIRASNNIAEENLNIAKQDLIKTIINAYSEVEQTFLQKIPITFFWMPMRLQQSKQRQHTSYPGNGMIQV